VRHLAAVFIDKPANYADDVDERLGRRRNVLTERIAHLSGKGPLLAVLCFSGLILSPFGMTEKISG